MIIFDMFIRQLKKTNNKGKILCITILPKITKKSINYLRKILTFKAEF